MNDGVFRAHRMLFIFYALMSAILSAGVVFDLIELHFYEAVQMGCIVAPFLAIALVHFFYGARRKKRVPWCTNSIADHRSVDAIALLLWGQSWESI